MNKTRLTSVFSFFLSVVFLCSGCGNSSQLPESLVMTLPSTYSLEFTSDGNDHFLVIRHGDTLYVDYEKFEGSYTDGDDYELFLEQCDEDETYKIYSFVGTSSPSADANGWYRYTNEGERSSKHFFAFRFLEQLGQGVATINSAQIDQEITPESCEYLSKDCDLYTIERDGYQEVYYLEHETNITMKIEDNCLDHDVFLTSFSILGYVTLDLAIFYPRLLPVE